MRQYITRRLLLTIPTLIFVSVVIFALMRVVPGDAAMLRVFGGENAAADPAAYEAARRQLGLDKSYPEQYADWVGRMICCLDFGHSFWTKKPVFEEVIDRFPITLELAVGTLIVALLIALPTGVISAIRQDSGSDYVARMIGVIGLSAPGFWIGTLLIVWPAIWWGYSAPLGYIPPHVDPWANFRQFIFPSIALGASFAATLMRMTRSQMLEVLRQDYIRTAWSKGLRERVVVLRHALRNALIPVVTLVGLDFGYLLGRTVIIETVFTLPGIGTSTIHAIYMRDYPQIQGNVLFIAFAFIMMNLAVDLAYAWVDPRIRYS